MKYYLILFALLPSAFLQYSFAQTNVGGDIISNTTWNLAGSPYIAQSDVVVDANVTLTIEAGVVVKFDKGISLGVNGTIRAIGNSSNLISFLPDTIGNPVDFYWAGIYISSTATGYDFITQDGCFFQYCRFTYSGVPNLHVDPSGNTTLTVFSQVSLGFDHCSVESSACGLVATSGSQISNNLFKECTSDFYSGYLIKVSQNSQVYKNLIYKTGVSTISGIMSVSKNVDVYDNLFIANSFVFSNVLNFVDSCQFYENTFVDNEIDDNSVSISLNGGSLYNNTFTRNNVGFQTFQLTNCDPDFHNNNILKNVSAVQGIELEVVAGNGSGQTANEENNYWGFSDSISIASIVKDFNDNSALCNIDFTPFNVLPDTNAPVIPPALAIKKSLNGSVHVWWNKNKEADLKGYRVYYGGYTGYSFTNSLDAGSDTSVDVPGILLNDPIGVTAYDHMADGTIDQYEGHESWFTLAVIDTTVGIDETSSSLRQILVFPNPSDGNIQIKLPASSTMVHLRIYNPEGIKISEFNSSGPSTISWQLPKAGVYFLEALSEGQVPGYQKIIVTK